ncbi:MAG: class I mannose-6-phosphate isomerase [Oscillospiraceae bacterium]|jgi:mannose-6-phosphate isomerase|nr:class I mannose-6-phosphate isomerase [Oscillospiraceae bacterium]
MRKSTPVFKDYIWGGTRLKSDYGKVTDLPRVAESWELTDGPVLIKLIDARESLSVQVHPDDEYARLRENGTGKTEMWVILECGPDAFVYLGFNREMTKGELRERAENGALTETLRVLPVRRGDIVFIPAGTIHAVGAGIVLAEVQQNSDLTYRVYDFDRPGADGKPRELHIERAVDVLRLGPSSPAAPGACVLGGGPDHQLERLTKNEYFTTDRLTLSGRYRQAAGQGSFLSVLCTEGDGTLGCGGETLNVTKGESVLVPAGSGEVSFFGIACFLLTTA